MKIMIFTSHPGDSIVACGGTMARYSKEGHDVIDVCATLGQAFRPDMKEEDVARIRNDERKKAAEVLGYQDVRNLGYRDTEFPYNRESVGRITNLIREERPDIVMTYWWQNVHPDLRNLSMAVSDALILAAFYFPSRFPSWNVKKLYQFPNLNSINWEPQIFVDITEFIEIKRKSLDQFELEDEQLRKWEGLGSKGLADLIVSQNRALGLYASVPYAEVFREFFAVEIKSTGLKHMPF